MKTKTVKKALALAVSLLMVFAMLPVTVFSEDEPTFAFETDICVAVNGVTASVSFDKESPQPAGTEVTATVTLAGDAYSTALHTVCLLSEKADFWGEAQDFYVTEGQTDFSDIEKSLKPYTFVVPAEAMNDLTLDHTCANPVDYTLYIYDGKGYENASDGDEINLDELNITAEDTQNGWKYILNSFDFVSTKREGVIIGGENVILELAGNFSIKCADAEIGTAVGLTVIGNLTVEGEGMLNVFAGNAADNSSKGIEMRNGSLTLNGGFIMAFAGETPASSFGVEISDENNGTLTVNDGTLMAFGKNGICVSNGLTVNGGTVEGVGTDTKYGDSKGISVNGNKGLTVNGGEIRGFAGPSEMHNSYGACVKGGVILNGGTAELFGGEAGENSCGISADSLTLEAGNLVAAGITYGVSLSEGGACTVIGGEAEFSGEASAYYMDGTAPTAPQTLDENGVDMMNVMACNDTDSSFAEDVTDWLGDGSYDVSEYKYLHFFPGMRDVCVFAEPIEGGTVTGEGLYSVYEEITVTAEANDGWDFVGWTENGKSVSTDASYTFSVTEGRNLVAVFEKHIHAWTAQYSSDEARHWKICTLCGEASTAENHSGGKATCTEKAICAACGKTYGNKNANEHSSKEFIFTVKDSVSHNKLHKCCNAPVAEEAHVFEDEKNDTQCKHCSYERIIYGNIDKKDGINATDARLCLRAAVGLETYAVGSYEYLACNVDGKGEGKEAITAADARLVLRRAVGLDKIFPVEEM